MRFLWLLTSAALFYLPSPQQSQQNVLLRVDTSSDNRCMKSNQGGMWVLESPGAPNINSPVGTVQVTVQRTDNSMNPQYPNIQHYSISSGQTIELDCAGKSVSYSLVTQ
jgi:hypothetical protein